jgi:predicted nucleotidyltransferase
MKPKDATRLLLRLPPDLYRRVKARAEQSDESINSVLVQAIEHGLLACKMELVQSLIIRKARAQLGQDFVGLLIYGSRARGDFYDTSDADLLLVVSDKIQIKRELYRAWDQILPDEVSLNIAHMPVADSNIGSLWLECALDARIIYDPSGVIRRRLEEIRGLILSGAYVRKTTHGQGYWIK